MILVPYRAPYPSDLLLQVGCFVADLGPERAHFMMSAWGIRHSSALVTAEDDAGTIWGLAGYQEGDDRCVFFVCVRSVLQGRGWGLTLSDCALRMAPAGTPVVLSVHADHPPALRLYEGLGFREVERLINMRREPIQGL